MSEYAIVTDSSCDLPAFLARDLQLTVLPLTFHLDGHDYQNLLDGSEMSFEEFYLHIREGKSCTTSGVNPEAFARAMEPLLQQGMDVLCVCFSSALSNTCDSARQACAELAPKYPERTLRVVDTLAASLGEGLLVYHAARQRQAGRTLAEVYNWLEAQKLHLCHWFTVEDLGYLRRGGRISGATAFFGTMLQIKPVLHMDNKGCLVNVSKARGRRASLDALVDRMADSAVHPQEQTVFISHGDCLPDAEYVANQVKKRLGVQDVRIGFVGPVIGAHSGPGTIALFFFGASR